MRAINVPVVIVPTTLGEAPSEPQVKRILVGLDGSIPSEAALLYAREVANAAKAEILLLSVPAVPETEKYRAAADVVQALRQRAEAEMRNFLEAVAESLRAEGLRVQVRVTGFYPARMIVSMAEEEAADMIMLTSRGRGGVDLLFAGSVAERVVDQSPIPVLMVPTSNGKK